MIDCVPYTEESSATKYRNLAASALSMLRHLSELTSETGYTVVCRATEHYNEIKKRLNLLDAEQKGAISDAG